eukprot:CAMPEP_0184695364 /NCGR_PEP_ID=MMETSP0313-20130426/3015_1 /TAXON_ID=2792 /ORGANISM="Porphyridium aerugineum, Strain SAG 1380-2" /LENGTH=582 /DNA_ID=CAMNT_0027153801 /DNA_START=149 /DNA_END=1897 /DNA_ORIENTATION=-
MNGNGSVDAGQRHQHDHFQDNYEEAHIELEMMLDYLKPVLLEYTRQTAGHPTHPSASQHEQPDQTYPTRSKVVHYASSKYIKQHVDLSLPQSEPRNADEMMQRITTAIQDLLHYSVKTANPLFLHRLYTGSQPIGQISELLLAVLNSSPDTYAVAPLFTIIQREILVFMGDMFGYEHPCGGTLCPGGSYSNMLAMTTARNQRFPEIKKEGMFANSLRMAPVVFTSAQAHYSISRAAMVLGIGTNQVIKVPCDQHGVMIPSQLEELIQRTEQDQLGIPFMVCATAGTTVLAAFDPLNEIAQICQQHNMWFHVDACYGGGAIFSKKHQGLLDGVSKADSIAWNPHKLLGVPLQCSLLLTKQPNVLRNSVSSVDTEYIYHHDHEEQQYDTGDDSLQCGRRADAVKLWLAWKRYGAEGFEKRVDHAVYLANRFVHYLMEDGKSRLRLLVLPYSFNVCFWYVPASLTNESQHNGTNGYHNSDMEQIDGCMIGTALKARDPRQPILDLSSQVLCTKGVGLCPHCSMLDQTTRKLYRLMQLDGLMLINYSTLTEYNAPSFFRVAFNNPCTNDADLQFIVEKFLELGSQL